MTPEKTPTREELLQQVREAAEKQAAKFLGTDTEKMGKPEKPTELLETRPIDETEKPGRPLRRRYSRKSVLSPTAAEQSSTLPDVAVSVDQTKDQAVEKAIKFPTKEGEIMDFLDAAGEKVSYVCRENSFGRIDSHGKEEAPITAEELQTMLSYETLHAYSDGLAEQLRAKAVASEKKETTTLMSFSDELGRSIGFALQDSNQIDFLNEDGKSVKYMYREGEGFVNVDPSGNEVKPITTEALKAKLASKELYLYSDELAEQLEAKAAAGGEDSMEGAEEHENGPEADAVRAKFSGPPDEISQEEQTAARAALGLDEEPSQEIDKAAEAAQTEAKESVVLTVAPGAEDNTEKKEETLQEKIKRLKDEAAEKRIE